MNPQLVMYEEEYNQINAVCEWLSRAVTAKVVFLVDKNGQLISAQGATADIDTTSLASLVAGNVAAMGGLAKLIGENEFPNQFHEGTRDSLYMTIIGSRVVLVVVFDAKVVPVGMIQVRVKKATKELTTIFEGLLKKAEQPGAGSPFAEITDDDIDNLFS